MWRVISHHIIMTEEMIEVEGLVRTIEAVEEAGEGREYVMHSNVASARGDPYAAIYMKVEIRPVEGVAIKAIARAEVVGWAQSEPSPLAAEAGVEKSQVMHLIWSIRE
jgi:hypothetical protein